jgi:hypothetical protein
MSILAALHITYPRGTLRGVFGKNCVYKNVTGWDAFEPALTRAEEMDIGDIWRIAAEIPEEWYEFDNPGGREAGNIPHQRSNGGRQGLICLPLLNGTSLVPIIRASQKSAPEELTAILLLSGWAGVGSRVGLPVYAGAFRLAAVPVHHNGGRRFLRRVLSSIRRDRGCVRFYERWQ